MDSQLDNSIDVQAALDFAKRSNEPKTNQNGKINLTNYNHGDVIVTDDGIPGIVIDREKKLRDIAENDPELNMMKTLMDPSDPTFSKLDPAIDKPDGTNEAMEKYLAEHEEVRLKRAEVQSAFAGFEIGGNGMLVPANDPRARLYAEAMEKIRTGEVRLPTVKEYEEQEKMARQRNIELANKRINEEKARQSNQTKQDIQKEEPKQVSVQKNIDELEEMNMSAEERQQVIENAKQDPMMAAITAHQQKEETQNSTEDGQALKATVSSDETGNTSKIVLNNDSEVKPHTVNKPDTAAKQPIDLFAAQEKLNEITGSSQQENEPEPVQKEEPVDVTIDVPADKADTFIEHLRPRTSAKIEAAKKIKVNYTKDVVLPKAAKRITDIDNYRAVAPRNVSSDIVPRLLLNSGYIAYFKPCGALKWSRLSPPMNEDGEFEELDDAKIIQFCYEQLATTSIGNMSLRKFLENTSIEDIPAMLHAIMGASLPDEQEVILTCGACKNEFETTYSISELADYDSMDEEASKQAELIESVKNIIDDAKDVHDDSPVMKSITYNASSTGSIFMFKHTDLAMSIDRQPVMKYLTERYGPGTALISTVVSEVYVKVGNDDTDDDWAISTDPTVICEELLRLSTDNLDEIKAILPEIPMIPSITYSIKGMKVCSNCGSELTNLTQDIRSLVFQIALKAQYFV